MTAISLDPLDLAALLCSRVCHDVISPVGAIVNALEVLEEDDPSMREFALELIKKSARQASASLGTGMLGFRSPGGSAIAAAGRSAMASIPNRVNLMFRCIGHPRLGRGELRLDATPAVLASPGPACR